MSIVATPDVGSFLDPASFDFVRALVLEKSAIALEENKGYLVESRLSPLARKLGFKTLRELCDAVRRKTPADLPDQVVDAMTTNETSFFRDVHPFETLRTALLPDLIARRANRRCLNIWSAACSSGQEPYTLAMLLTEHFPQLASWQIKIYATDLSQEMLGRAKAGSYSQAEVNRGLPASMLVKYFDRDGLQWVVKPAIRQKVTFAQLNLLDNWNMLPCLDVIFMRNVLIYFKHETKRKILANIRRFLAPDGYLLLGGAETTIGIDDAFHRLTLGKSTFYRLTPENPVSPSK